MVQRYGQVSSVAGKIQRKYVKKAVPEGGCFLFLFLQATDSSISLPFLR